MGQYWRLRDAQGKPPGVMGWWPSRSVTFLDNHDTGSTQVIMSHKYIFYALRFINRVHMFAYFFFLVALTGSLAFPFTPYYGGKEVLQKNTITSLRFKFSLMEVKMCVCVFVGLCIYTYASRHPMCVLWPLLWLGKLDSWPDCQTGMLFTSLQSLWLTFSTTSWYFHSVLSLLFIWQIDVRRRQDIHSRSTIRILEAKSNLYAAIVGEKLCMKLGDASWCPSGREWTLATSGHRYAVWHK